MTPAHRRAPGAGVAVLDPLPVTVPRPMVLLRLGYRRAAQVPPKVSDLLDAVFEEGRRLLAPRAIHAMVDVQVPEAGPVVLGETVRTDSRSLRERLAGCRQALVFAATIGAEVETWSQGLLDDDQMARGLLADAFASSAAIALGLEVEKVAGKLLAGARLEPTRRHAPGYGDWDLSSQRPLLAMVDAGRIGITLTDEFLMIPAKSISGVIGGRPGRLDKAPAGRPA